jgi:hypothetical protein
MPLYNISPPKGFNSERPYLDYTDDERHDIWINVRFNFRKYQGNILPAFYVSTTVFLILMDSENFKLFNTQKDTNKVGYYDSGTVYVSKKLDTFEYYIGIEETEILEYQRYRKLNKLKQKLCGHITEERQK